jgi:hypothetical protein
MQLRPVRQRESHWQISTELGAGTITTFSTAHTLEPTSTMGILKQLYGLSKDTRAADMVTASAHNVVGIGGGASLGAGGAVDNSALSQSPSKSKLVGGNLVTWQNPDTLPPINVDAVEKPSNRHSSLLETALVVTNTSVDNAGNGGNNDVNGNGILTVPNNATARSAYRIANLTRSVAHYEVRLFFVFSSFSCCCK